MFLHFQFPKCDPSFLRPLTLLRKTLHTIFSLYQHKLSILHNLRSDMFAVQSNHLLCRLLLTVLLKVPVARAFHWAVQWHFMFYHNVFLLMLVGFPLGSEISLLNSLPCNKNLAWLPKSVQVSPVVDWRSRFSWHTIPYIICSLTCQISYWSFWNRKQHSEPWCWKIREDMFCWFWKEFDFSKSCQRQIANLFTVFRPVWSWRGPWFDWRIWVMAWKGMLKLTYLILL